MADEQPYRNGDNRVRDHRLEQIEKRLDAHSEGVRYNAEGAIRRDERIGELRADVDLLKEHAAEVPVLSEKVDTLVDGWRAVRNAFLAAAGGMVLLAASIMWQATS